MVALVRGKQIIQVSGEDLRREACLHERVVVDLGAGDGRFAYRLARTHPAWYLLAVDASADGMRDVSFRASRKPSRGGVANARFVRAAIENLPDALSGIADEIYVLFPWGSLLWAVAMPDPVTLGRIARLGKRGARLYVRVNTSILADQRRVERLGLRDFSQETVTERLAPAYAAAGIRIAQGRWDQDSPISSWGKRLGTGKRIRVLALDGTVEETAVPLTTS